MTKETHPMKSDGLRLEQKASLLSGESFRGAQSIPEADVPSVVRRLPGEDAVA
jgi:hypothetical protein